MDYQPIRCDLHDYLEIACMHRLTLKINIKDGDCVEAKASDLYTREKVEYLWIELPGEQKELRLDSIDRFSHPEFGTIELTKG